MKVTYSINRIYEGELGEILNVEPKTLPTLEEVLSAMANLCFIVECVAHLQGKEEQLLPVADKARRIIKELT